MAIRLFAVGVDKEQNHYWLEATKEEQHPSSVVILVVFSNKHIDFGDLEAAVDYLREVF